MNVAVSNQSNREIMFGVSGRIDSYNFEDFEAKLEDALQVADFKNVTIDLKELQYISSAGLRVFLKLAKKYNLSVMNLSDSVYEIFDSVGFNQVMRIKKMPRTISVDGLNVVGRGSTGTVYQLDDDRVIKAFYEFVKPEYIESERDIASKIFLMGLPAAVVFDVVKTKENYGIIYEMINANSLATLLEQNDADFQKYVNISVELMKEIHKSTFDTGDFGTCYDFWMPYFNAFQSFVTESEFEQACNMMKAIPLSDNFVHGDFHPGNIMLRGEEAVMIDISSASRGHFIYDLAAVCTWSKILANALGDAGARMVTGVGKDKLIAFWEAFLTEYCKDCPQNRKLYDDWCTAFGALRVYSAITSPGMFPEEGLNWCKKTAFEILDNGLGELK